MLPIKLHFEEAFFAEEEQCGFLVDKQRKELWAVELDLLNEFDKVCRKYNLKYYLDGGTLLGAVRHKGYIPWDDDIDVNMLREDYNKLLEIAPKEFKEPYFFQTMVTDPGYIRGFAKLRNSETAAFKRADLEDGKIGFNQGIFIDIFPLDYLPETAGELDKKKLYAQRQRILACEKKIHRLVSADHKRAFNRLLCRLRRAVARMIYEPLEEVHEQIEAIYQENSPGKYVDEVSFLQYDRMRILEVSWYDEVEYVSFANLQAPIPKHYKEILTHYYGADYMTPKQVGTLHGELICDAHCSYRELFKQRDRLLR